MKKAMACPRIRGVKKKALAISWLAPIRVL
jgi:hypothetical protein